MANEEIAAKIRSREEERAAALVAEDWDLLKTILSDDLRHIHSTGNVETRSQYMKSMREKYHFKEISRPEPLEVRAYGDVAVATGRLYQLIYVKASGETVEMHATTTQVWVNSAGSWVQTSWQVALNKN